MSSESKGPSLISLIVGIVFLFAAIFGVTCGGTHYRLDCSSEQGVRINSKPINADAVPSAGPTIQPTSTKSKPTNGVIYQ